MNQLRINLSDKFCSKPAQLLIRGGHIILALLVVLNTLTPPLFSASSANAQASSRGLDVQSLPSDLAQIKVMHESKDSEGKPYFIYLQDAHSNPGAQQSIRQILKVLSGDTEADKTVVAVEGAVGSLRPEILDFFKDYPEANEIIRNDLLSKGELTGVELYAHDLFTRGKFRKEQFVGVEDPELYREHGNAYDQVVAETDQIEDFMNGFRSELTRAEAKILNPRLSKFLKEVMRRRDGQYSDKYISAGTRSFETVPQLDIYLKTLMDYARENLSIDLEQLVEQLRFPQVFRLRIIQKMSGSWMREQAVEKWKLYYDQFGPSVSPEVMASLAAAFEATPSQTPLSAREALEKLVSENPKAYEALIGEEALKRGVAIGMLQSEMDSAALVAEMDQLQYAIAQKMVTTLKESLWLQLHKDYGRLGSLFRMELTREDWSLIQKQPNQLSPDALVRRLKFLGYGKKFNDNLIGFAPYEAAYAYYQVAELRDEALLKNTLRAARDNHAKRVILISGGFHTEGIQESLAKQGYSYAVIRPAIARAESNQLYYKAMRRENSNVFNQANLHLSSEQVALTLKEILDVGIPQIAAASGKSDAELAEIVRVAVTSHPVLKDALEVSVVQDSAQTGGAHLVFTTPGFNFSARVKQLYTGDQYASLQSADDLRVSWPLDIRGGHPMIDFARVRSEVRATPASSGYRRYGAARTPEEAQASVGRENELPGLERVREDIKKHLAELGRAGGKLTGQEFAEFAGHRNRGYFTGVSAPQPGRDVIAQSTLEGFQAEASRDESLSAAFRGIQKLAQVIPSADEKKYQDLGRELLRAGKVEVVSLAGGMSVRGAIYANQYIYIPGYGKIPLLGIQILNAYHLAKKEGLKKIPFTIAESDYTAKNVSEVLRWLAGRGFIKVADIQRFDVSVINRIDGAGEYFAEDHREGYAVASHFDGLLYYIYSGQFARAKKAGVEYAKFSNMNIPTATLDLGIIGYLAARRQSAATPATMPGVLIEQTLNKNEKGGFRATAHYTMPNGETPRVQQMIESFIVEGTPDFKKLVDHKEEYPVFNANSIVVSLDWIEEFFGLKELTEPPTFENVKNPNYRRQLVELVGKKISQLGDEDPGRKIQLYYELKKIKRSGTEHSEFILQISRLLGQTATIDANSVFYTVPRQTETASRYDEAKKLKNIAANAPLFAKYLIDQLPKPRQADKPVVSADRLMARLNKFYLGVDAMNEESHRGSNAAFKLQTAAFEAEAFDFYNYLLRGLDVRDLAQIAEYEDYLDQIDAVPEISQKIHQMQTFMGGRRSEVRIASAVLPTAEFTAQLGDQPDLSENAAVKTVAMDFGGVFEDSANGRRELRAYLTLPAISPLSAAEMKALGPSFIKTFFAADSTRYHQADQYLLRENAKKLPLLNSEMKLWVRYLATHPDFTWVLDADDVSLQELQSFKNSLLTFARDLGTPIQPNQIRVSVSGREGFDLWLLDRPVKDQIFGYLSGSKVFLTPTQPDTRASFRRTHQARALDRMLAAEALRRQIPDDLQRAIGPLSELASVVFKASYASLEAGFAAYQRLAVSA